jgi:hypothetical protein
MEQPVQHQHQHHGQRLLEDADSAPTWRPPLTSSSLQELRHGDESEQTIQPVSPIMSRRTSLDSDRFSTLSGLTSYFPNNPTNINPPPAYVAPFGASQVVSENQASNRRHSSDEEDDFKQNKDDVQFSEPALSLVNAFLDQLLFSFLSTARSTSLLALRPAVTEVLKHRLAKEAIASAEEELSELLAGGDDEEEMDSKQKQVEDSRKWDLELVWKRTRLRVMVYMRLGEMEDEDEQRYVKEEELFHGSERRFSQSSGLVSWAAAIFLTSVLEYVAEQTLQVSGQAAYTRARRQSRAQRLAATHARTHENLVVEDHDVEKVALNSTLGRLWRTWRKALRNNAAPSSPTHRSTPSLSRLSRDNMASALSQRRSSFGTVDEGSVVNESRPRSIDQKDDLTEMDYPEHVLAANIPLPIGNSTRDIDEIVVPGLASDPEDDSEEKEISDEPYPAHELGSLVPLPMADDKRDVDEIEVPGLARDPDVDDNDAETYVWVASKDAIRRNSFVGVMPIRTTEGPPTPENSNPSSPTGTAMSPIGRQRSMSLPTPTRTPLSNEELEQKAVAEDVSEEEVVPEASPPAVEGAQDEKSGNAFPWMAGGAVAATAATVSAWAMGTKRAEVDEPAKSMDSTRNLPVPTAQSVTGKGLGGLIQSANHEDVAGDEEARSNGVLDIKKDTSQQSLALSDKDIEELDKRKSLIDIKSMMVVNGVSGPGSGQESPQKPQSPMQPALGTPDALDNREAGVSEEEGPDDAIGVARTADVLATLAPRGTEGSTPNEELLGAREPSNRPARLILDESSSRALENQGQPLTPGTQQRQFLDLTSETEAPESQSEQNRSPSKSTQRASLANGAQQSPSVASSPHRQSLTASVEKKGSSKHKKQQSSESPIQDHPVIQRMASLTGKEPKSPRSPRLVNESEQTAPLTSASIRGPEDFDMFVQGIDTLKYTLTPENVRFDPVGKLTFLNGARTDGKQGPSDATYGKSGASPVEMDATSTRTGRSLIPKQTGAIAAEEDEDFRSSKRRSISRPSARNFSVHRKSGLMAREPRVLTESTRDFADFIRSTGPKKDATLYPILPNASTTSLHSLRPAHIQGASASRSSSPGADQTRARPSGDDTAVPPVPPVPSRSKTTLQPRGATTVSGGSAELIDFIRSGPDDPGKHRISRTVAPFRSTMDSDQLRDLGDRLSTERNTDLSVKPSASSFQSASSMRSSSLRTSANSRSALLSGPTPSDQTTQPAYSGQPQKLSGSTKNSQENDRKRYRNKDPYAMYDMDDDEDDEDLLTSLPKTTRKEESLLDFLSNNEPPTSAAPQPLINPNSTQARNIINNARANGFGSQMPVGGSEAKTRSVSNSAGPRSSQAGPSRQATLNSSISPATGRPKMQARGGVKDISQNSNTRELADFFKSAPPEDPDSAPAPIVGRDSRNTSKEMERAKKKTENKKSGGFFGRSRKKTYLDMP